MSYIEQNLMANEQLVYKAKLHKVIFLLPALCAIVLFAVGIKVLTSAYSFKEVIGVGLILIGLLILAIPYVQYKTSEFGVTNKRVIIKLGLIQRDTAEMFLQKIEAVNVSQNILGRILNFGTIRIIGTGGSTEAFNTIAAPLAFRLQIQEQIDASQNAAKNTTAH
jgi:uncharacterized membrane protein YdbT with pleckstrin-like domain